MKKKGDDKMKQHKILEIHEGKWHYVCVKTDEKPNPYRLYRTWWDMGNHRKPITKYADFDSIMWTLHQIINLGKPEEDYIWNARKKSPTQ